MIQKHTKPDLTPAQDPRQIPKWSRTYAQNRSLGLVVMLGIFFLISGAIAGLSILGGMAYREGNMPLMTLWIALLIPVFAALIYVSVPKWSMKLQDRILERLYGNEGSVAFASEDAKGKTIWIMLLGGLLLVGVLSSVLSGFLVEIPPKYMQPISTIYIVPFLVGIWLLQRPLAGPAALLWPVLYAIHAILIMAGAPIVFEGPLEMLNMVIPVVGYGMLAGLVGHLHSRVALRWLKALTQPDSVDSVVPSGGADHE